MLCFIKSFFTLNYTSRKVSFVLTGLFVWLCRTLLLFNFIFRFVFIFFNYFECIWLFAFILVILFFICFFVKRLNLYLLLLTNLIYGTEIFISDFNFNLSSALLSEFDYINDTQCKLNTNTSGVETPVYNLVCYLVYCGACISYAAYMVGHAYYRVEMEGLGIQGDYFYDYELTQSSNFYSIVLAYTLVELILIQFFPGRHDINIL